MKALSEMNNTEKAHLLVKLFPNLLKELEQVIQEEKERKKIRLTKRTTKKVDEALDKVLINLHQKAGTITGDITPEQEYLLESLKTQLVSLMIEQVFQNL